MPYEWYNLLGFLGVLLIVGTYLLLQIGRLASEGLAFSLLNGAGAFFVLVSLVFEFNFAAFVLELFWLVISIIGLWRALRTRRKAGKFA